MEKPNFRTAQEIISDIQQLVKSKGYIYALCLIIIDDFHINVEKLHEIDNYSKLNLNEISFLLGFVIQSPLDFTQPDSPEDLIKLKEMTNKLMEELHQSFHIPFFNRIQTEFLRKQQDENYESDSKTFFGDGEMLVEPIFYAGTGIYDFQYLEYLKKKYKYDQDWLLKEKNFNIEASITIVENIKSLLNEKLKRINHLELKKRWPELVEKMKLELPKEALDEEVARLRISAEFYQFVELFEDENINKENEWTVKEQGWNNFYSNLIDTFCFSVDDFTVTDDLQSFLTQFSVEPHHGLNSNFDSTGKFNLINAQPIIKLNENKYFVPIVFFIYKAVYESPFYWMMKDDSYIPIAETNRGIVSEEITYDLISPIFGSNRTYKSVKIQANKRETLTDIDILCILGSKALCIQVKSKMLTILARQGNDKKLQEDFKAAVQDAYDQGIISRAEIISNSAKFIDENGNEINIPEAIDEAYIMCITTENYPSLTHQAHILLEKDVNNPFPIVMTIFDLELVCHYLPDPFDFLYYIKQRIELTEFFKADEEMAYLGFHLMNKLWKSPSLSMEIIGQDYTQLIDRNYYPFKLGLNIGDEGDDLLKRVENADFKKLTDQLKQLSEPKITDIIFYLQDLSDDAKETLVKLILQQKQRTQIDGRGHDFSLPPDDKNWKNIGFSYYSLHSNDVDELRRRLITLCMLRKYKSKADIWIGFGSIKDSDTIVDALVFNETPWEYNDNLERESNQFFKTPGQFYTVNKRGRNEKCYCGSGLKYKRCCGR